MDPTGAQITPKMDTAPCDGRSPVTVTAAIRDGGVGGIDQVVRVAWSWTGFITGGVTQTQPTGPGEWSVTIGTITYDGKPIQGGTFTVTATAFDQHGQSTTLTSGPVTVMPCIDTEPPTILGVIPSPLTIYWSTQCGSLQSTLTVRATDNSGLQLAASARYQVGDIWFDAGLNRTGFNEWTGVIGPISERLNTRTVIPIAVSVRDAAGNIREGSTSILFDPCIIIT